jgi:hypothetical protein
MVKLKIRSLLSGRSIGLAALASVGFLDVGARASGDAPLPLGVYLGNGQTGVVRMPEFTKWLGREPERILDFLAYDSWASFESDTRWTCSSWRGVGSQPVAAALTVSVPLTVQGTSLAEVAAGAHDQTYVTVARILVENGWARSVVRLGWEFNGAWMPWAAGKDPKSYVKAYRRVVWLMRSAHGARFTFDWCCACGRNEIAPDSVYPGDDVVDIIGMDVYTRYYNAFDAVPALRWNSLKTTPFGLDWLVRFSRQHEKKLSVPEWGTGEALTPDGGSGGGDDALFVENMAGFLRENRAAYSDYWDFHAPDYNARVSDGEHPRAGAALMSFFGTPRRPIAPE